MDQLSPTPIETRTGAIVDIRALHHSFGAVDALRSVDITIDAGEFVALLGPSGCGKTTLLRSIAGLVVPTSGEILIDGLPITRTPVHKRDLGMVFQSYALFPHMTVADNVRFGLKMHGVRGDAADHRIAEALALVQMSDYLERYPAQLSGGQQQRVTLSRPLVTRPKALLLDEPFGALDAKLRVSMQIELRRLQRALGITTVFVTHDQQEALSMADRVAVMRDGRIEQFDSPEQIYNAPETPFVADFIGEANRFQGVLIAADGTGARVSFAGSDVLYHVPSILGAKPGDGILAMVRPERVFIDVVAGPDDIGLSGKVADMIFVGEKVSVYVETDIGVIAVSVPHTARRAGAAKAPGDSVSICLAREDLLVWPLPN